MLGIHLLQGTNILFINGSEDPWSVLSIDGTKHTALQKSARAVYMDGVSHCADMRRWRRGGKPTVEAAQKHIKHQLFRWAYN